jgi:VWFA-related protein
MDRTRWVALFAASALTLVAPARAHGPFSGTNTQNSAQSSAQAVPVFRTNANLVLVDVVVSDQGKPVLDLQRTRFQIDDNGKRQPITVFEEHRASDAIQAAHAPALPPTVYSDYPQYTVTSAANVLLLDSLNTPLADQKYARLQMLKFLNTIPPGTQIAVFTLGSRLRLVSGFTTDQTAVAESLGPGRGNAQGSPVMDPQFVGALKGAAELAKNAGASPMMIAAMRQLAADTATYQVDQRMQITMDAMQEMARYLSTIPGRKNLIWFSGSFPGTIAPDNTQMDPTRAERDYLAAVMKTDELMARARVAVYPVDARGLMDLYSSDTGMEDNPCLANPPCNPAGKEEQLEKEFLYQNFAEHNTMDQIARDTGGRAFYNSNTVGQALAEAIADGSNYYTIGFVPDTHNFNGVFHRIRVKVASGPYNLSYRQGYYANSPEQQARRLPTDVDPLVAAMEPGAPPLSQLIFEARVSAVATAPAAGDESALAGALAETLKAPLAHYVIDYSIDPRMLAAETLPDGRKATDLELTQVAYDLDGHRLNYTDNVQPVPVESTIINGRERGIHLRQEIDLPEAPVRLRIGVHDMTSGQIGTIEISILPQLETPSKSQ